MYYFIYSFDRQRKFNVYKRNAPMTPHNKFDLEFIRKSIGDRFAINNWDSRLPLCSILKTYELLELPKRYFFVEISDPADAMWAKLNSENLVKNVEKYGIKYHGSVGPITDEIILEIKNYQREIQNEIESLTNDKNMIRKAMNSVDSVAYSPSSRVNISLTSTLSRKSACDIDALDSNLSNYFANYKMLMKTGSDIQRECRVLQNEIQQTIEEKYSDLENFVKSKIHASST